MNFFAVQFDIVWEKIQENLEKIERLLDNAGELKGGMIFLPEMFATGYTMKPSEVLEDVKVAIDWLKQFSRENNCLIGGSLPVFDNGKFFNRFYIYADGKELAIYDKRHLFSNAGEHKVYCGGNKIVTFEYNGWKVKPVVCYDLRFPVWLRNTEGYDLLVVVANWPAKRDEVWRLLLKTRAVENQAYVLGVNRVGEDGNGFEYAGSSVFVDAKGKIIADMENKEGVMAVRDVSKKELYEFRNKFDTLKDADKFNIIL
jgi:omega-amidase